MRNSKHDGGTIEPDNGQRAIRATRRFLLLLANYNIVAHTYRRRNAVVCRRRQDLRISIVFCIGVTRRAYTAMYAPLPLRAYAIRARTTCLQDISASIRRKLCSGIYPFASNQIQAWKNYYDDPRWASLHVTRSHYASRVCVDNRRRQIVVDYAHRGLDARLVDAYVRVDKIVYKMHTHAQLRLISSINFENFQQLNDSQS